MSQGNKMKKLLITASLIFATAGAVWFMQPAADNTDNELSEITVSGSLNTSILILLAEEKGFFAEENLKVNHIEVLAAANAMQNLIAKNADIGVLVDTNVGFIGYQKDVPFKVIASTGTYYTHSLFARKDRGINTPQDLIGKTIGVQPVTAPHFSLDRFLKYHNISIDDVNISYLTSPVAVRSAITSGEADAVIVWDPHRYYALKELGNNVVDFRGNQKVYRVDILLAAHNDAIKNRRQDVDKFLRAIKKAENYLLNNDEEVKLFAGNKIGLKPEVTDSFWDDVNLKLDLNQSHLELVKANGEWIQTTQEGFIGKELPNYEELFDLSFIAELEGN